MRRWTRRGKCSLAAILLLGLLSCAEPTSAQTKEYTLTVAVHDDVSPPLNEADIRQILKDASDLLKNNEGYRCDVEFKLGSVQRLTAPVPPDIKDEATLEAVHNVDAHVKVVRSITFCINGPGSGIKGCAWRPQGRQKTVIVTNFVAPNLRDILWAHEFGHTTGLAHRVRDNSEPVGSEPLMTGCKQAPFTTRINRDECDHFRAGPTLMYPDDPIINCDEQNE